MKSLRNSIESIAKRGPIAVMISTIASVLLITGLMQAATTVSTNVVTDGIVRGNYASSTVLSVNNTSYFGGTASTTIDVAGNITGPGTLSIVGTATLGRASTTVFSVNNTAFFGGTATTTIGPNGDIVAASTTATAFNLSGKASTTVFSVNNTAFFGGTATTTIGPAGNIVGAGTLLVNGSTTLQNFTFQNATSTTSNTATSTLSVGCIQVYATSTATAVRLEIGAAAIATASSTSFRTGGDLSEGMVLWAYGSCP